MNDESAKAGVETIAGTTTVVLGGPASGNAPTPGVVSRSFRYEEVKHLLVDRPLCRHPYRPLSSMDEPDLETVEYEDEYEDDAEEARDVENATRVLSDPNRETVSLEDLRRELGL